MPTRDQFITQSRTYLNTKWQHQGRSREGIDCVGIFYAVAVDLGIFVEDDRNYSKRPGSARLIQRLLERCDEIDVKNKTTGDVLLVSVAGEDPQHLMLMTSPTTVLHSSAKYRKVVEHRLDDETRRGLCKVFRPRIYNG